MATLYINARCEKLLNILLSRSDYMAINQLAQALSVSRRTAYYDIYKVNMWLEQAGLSQLKVVREKGVFLAYKERERVQELLETDTKQQVYIYSPDERAKLIICYVIYSQDPVYIEQLISKRVRSEFY